MDSKQVCATCTSASTPDPYLDGSSSQTQFFHRLIGNQVVVSPLPTSAYILKQAIETRSSQSVSTGAQIIDTGAGSSEWVDQLSQPIGGQLGGSAGSSPTRCPIVRRYTCVDPSRISPPGSTVASSDAGGCTNRKGAPAGTVKQVHGEAYRRLCHTHLLTQSRTWMSQARGRGVLLVKTIMTPHHYP